MGVSGFWVQGLSRVLDYGVWVYVGFRGLQA